MLMAVEFEKVCSGVKFKHLDSRARVFGIRLVELHHTR